MPGKWVPEFNGDPRGCVFSIKNADGVEISIPS
jgi:hypothetical protein